MPAGWSRAETSRCWRWRAAMSPAPGRRRDPHYLRARSRTPAGWVLMPRYRREVCLSEALLTSFFFCDFGGGFRPIQLLDEISKAVRHALPHHVVVHGPELVPDPGLNLGIQSALLLHFFHDLIHAPPEIKSLFFKMFPRNGPYEW